MDLPQLHLFNPENDLALAHGNANYTMPPLVRQLKRDLQLLPAWLARDGDLVAVDDNASLPQCQGWLAASGLGVKTVAMGKDAALEQPAMPRPWGWSSYARRLFLDAGMPAASLPSAEAMSQLRQLSHRRTAIAALKELRKLLPCVEAPLPVEINSLGELERHIAAHPGCYLKAPWSGSGRGVRRAAATLTHDVAIWARGIITRQGSIIAEEALNRTLDFAIEFASRGGAVRATDYSVFATDAHNQYSSGLVASNEALRGVIARQFPAIADVQPALEQVLSALIAPHYTGPLGVDMLLYRKDGLTLLDPCVEINLRATMGMLCAALYKRCLPQGGAARFGIEYSKTGFPASSVTPASTSQLATRWSHSSRPVAAGSAVPLTPVTAATRFRATLTPAPQAN